MRPHDFKKTAKMFLAAVLAGLTTGLAPAPAHATIDAAAGVLFTSSAGGGRVVASANWSRVFPPNNNFGQNLYTAVYEKVAHEASDKAVSMVSDAMHMSKEEMQGVIEGINIGRLFAGPDPLKQMSDAEIRRRREELADRLSWEKRLADLETMAKMDTEPIELFSNGDEEDSGFDLITDLNNIEIILFGPGAGAGGGGGGGGGGEEPAANAPGSGAGAPSASAGAPTTGPGGEARFPSGRATRALSSGEPAGGAGEQEGNSTQANPADQAQGQILCPVNQAFNDAVVSARQQEQEDERSGDAEAGPRGGAPPGGPPAGGGTTTSRGDAGTTTSGGGPSGNITDAMRDWWEENMPCGEVFCLTVEFTYRQTSLYSNSANCIACHVEKINDSFNKTLGHNLSPSKQTGNLLESSKCKNAMLPKFGFGLVMIGQPILTPPNDDLIVKGDFLKNIVDAFKRYYGDPSSCSAVSGFVSSGSCPPQTTSDVLRDISKQVIEQSGEDEDIAAKLKKVEQRFNSTMAEREKTLQEVRLEGEALAQASQFNILMKQMDEFYTYFENFIKTYDDLSDAGNPDSACQQLKNLQACS